MQSDLRGSRSNDQCSSGTRQQLSDGILQDGVARTRLCGLCNSRECHGIRFNCGTAFGSLWNHFLGHLIVKD